MRKVVLLCFGVSFFSCQKIIDRLERRAPPSIVDCQIREINFMRSFDGVPSKKTLRFEYNEHGDPVFMNVEYTNQQDSDYGGECYFTYDELNRLIRYENNGNSIITYAYEGNSSLPVRDTILTFYHPKYVEDLQYDTKGRLTELKAKFYEDTWGDENYPLEYTTKYDYDDRGNLITEGYTYDSTKSLLRTNKVWMLASRNWSFNNSHHAETTNDKGLPTKFAFGEFLGHQDANMTVDYSCK